MIGRVSLVGPINSGLAVGADGVATANQSSPIFISGEVMGVYVRYNDTPPAGTTDVTVETAGSAGAVPAQTILTLTNQATSKLVYPRVAVQDTTGTNIAGEYSPIVIHDQIKVTIAQANAGDSADVWLLMRE